MKVRLIANMAEYILGMEAAQGMDTSALRDLNNEDGDRDEL